LLFLEKIAFAFGSQNKSALSWILISIFHADPDPGGKSTANPDPKH
jgi:hypothetical protein